jgi:DNA processing protein
MDTQQHQIALCQLPQVGAVTAKTLVSYCGSARAVFTTPARTLLKIPGIGSVVTNSIRKNADNALRVAEKELVFTEKNNIITVFYTDSLFPSRLLQSYDSPALIFFRGSDPNLLKSERIVSIVGTRQPTDHGRANCEALIEGLAQAGVMIVSGLAYGIDITAHRKACQVNIPNIGVLGHGLGSIYPIQHKQVAQRMVEYGGLITEFTHDIKPDRENFPMRNRIIAGICDALIVVETAASGGSMITASMANRLSCEVFAIPGRPQDPKSAGCNYLIRTHQAYLVETAEDVIHLMGWDESTSDKSRQLQLMLDLDTTEKDLVGIVKNSPEISIDQLTLLSGLSNGELASKILSLEFRGILKTLPGKRYVAIN